MELITKYKLLLDKRKKNPYIEDILELYKEIFREQITDNKLLLTSYTNLIFYLNSQLKDNTLLKEHRQHIKNQLKTITSHLANTQKELTAIEKIISV